MTDLAAEFDFGDIEIISIPVTGPDKKSYVLREANEDAAKHFANARARCARFKDGGMSGIDGIGDMTQVFLHSTLFHANEDGEADLKKPITRREIATWPARVTKPLFAKALAISEIDDDDDLNALRKQHQELGERIAKMEEDAAKNVPSGTESGLSLPESVDIVGPSES